MKKKLLIVCGPTAIGKTKLGIDLAKRFDGEIISCDSRQIYKGLDIGTGKDLPKDAKYSFVNKELGGYYNFSDIKVWGYDLVDPKDEFSIENYKTFCRAVLSDIWSRGKLPIIVGGTGFYIKAVVDGIETLSVPVDIELREKLSSKSSEELLILLKNYDFKKATSLNDSDSKNPRRLIRAIEVSLSKKDNYNTKVDSLKDVDILWIGLIASRETIFELVEKRVDERVYKGIEIEIKSLLKSGLSWGSQALSSIGYIGWKDYFEGKKSKEMVIEEWKQDEKAYVKRQLTWFKKEERINWFDKGEVNLLNKVEEMVKKWYYD